MAANRPAHADPDDSRDAAFECGRHDETPLHIRTLAHVNAIRIRRSTGWISDTTENLMELRRLAEGSQDPRVRFHLAWGEFLATAYGSDERKERVARLRSEAETTAIPTLIGTAELFIGAGGEDEAALRALHTATEIFEGVGNMIMVAAARSSFPDQVRSDTSSSPKRWSSLATRIARASGGSCGSGATAPSCSPCTVARWSRPPSQGPSKGSARPD